MIEIQFCSLDEKKAPSELQITELQTAFFVSMYVNAKRQCDIVGMTHELYSQTLILLSCLPSYILVTVLVKLRRLFNHSYSI